MIYRKLSLLQVNASYQTIQVKISVDRCDQGWHVMQTPNNTNVIYAGFTSVLKITSLKIYFPPNFDIVLGLEVHFPYI